MTTATTNTKKWIAPAAVGAGVALIASLPFYFIVRSSGGQPSTCEGVSGAISAAQQSSNDAFDTYELAITSYRYGMDLGGNRSYIDALAQRNNVRADFVALTDIVNNCS